MKRRIAGTLLLALSLAALQGCVEDPTGTETSELEGVWMLVQNRYALNWDGDIEKDTVRYDTASAYLREFYVIRGEAVFWVWYGQGEWESESQSTFTRLRRLSSSRWLLGVDDTLTVKRSGSVLTLELKESGMEYDWWMEDSVPYTEQSVTTLVAYHRPFPPVEWFEPPKGETEPNNTRTTANPLTPGSPPVVAALTSGDQDWYSFQAVSGQGYLIRTYGGTDTYMQLYRTGTTPLAENDDSFDGGNAGIYWIAETSNTHYVKVTGYNGTATGAYSVSVRSMDLDEWEEEFLFKRAPSAARARIPLHPLHPGKPAAGH